MKLGQMSKYVRHWLSWFSSHPYYYYRMAAAGAEAAAKQLRLAAGIKLHPALVPGALHELCKQVVTPELNSVVTELLGKVRMFHDRAAAKNAIKVRVGN